MNALAQRRHRVFAFPDYCNATPPDAGQIARVRLNRFGIDSSQTVQDQAIVLLEEAETKPFNNLKEANRPRLLRPSSNLVMCPGIRYLHPYAKEDVFCPTVNLPNRVGANCLQLESNRCRVFGSDGFAR
ncbi:hypothetical protein SAMN04488557_0920 [Hyphomicrobium facile]|uniref:Uncharacterized protein n=1 Tax=Hyphomicrobium facile TaxID=51670 RepID=A0A1I7N0H8_9HYPH|nr:hypothetical protein SAMN04488557_0920 [Hyphomicrobium facile]